MLDVVLEVVYQILLFFLEFGFNPCCAGCSSGSGNTNNHGLHFRRVSILVVLDVVLEDKVINLIKEKLNQFQSLLCWM